VTARPVTTRAPERAARAAKARVHGAQELRGQAGLERPRLAGGQELDALPAGPHVGDPALRELVLFGRVDGVERPGAAELEVLAEV
jgi:hypothetical protein